MKSRFICTDQKIDNCFIRLRKTFPCPAGKAELRVTHITADEHKWAECWKT